MRDQKHSRASWALQPRDWGKIAPTAAVILGFVILVHLLTAVQSGVTPAQVRFNLSFISETSFTKALSDYPTRWPPLYPVLAWSLKRLGVSEVIGNQLFFYGILAATGLWARRFIPGVHWAYPVLLLATLESSYAMVRNITAEMLFTLLALCALWLTARNLQSPSPYRTAAISLTGSALCMSRYFGVPWLGPLLTWYCWRSGAGSIYERGRRTLLFGFGFLAPVAAWLLHSRLTTGFWSGQNRLERRRPGEPGLSDQLIDITHIVKTHLVDFFSVQDWGRHKIINPPYEPQIIEYVIAGLASVLAIAIVVTVIRSTGRLRPIRPSAETRLLLQFAFLYPVMILLLWSVGNPDRIYTRFLYPSYPLLILVGTALYGWARQGSPPRLLLWSFRGFYLLVLAVQCIRHAPHLWAAFD